MTTVRIRLAAALGALGLALAAGAAVAQDVIGQPSSDWRDIGMQPGVTEIAHQQAFFHNVILMPVITVISVFVLGLLLWVAFRYNKRANPEAARFTHNTAIEVAWTVVPVLILMTIAIFSFRLLFAYHDVPPADYTVKVTGYQWYWTYELPDQEIPELTSIILSEEEARAQGRPVQLAVDNPLVVPVGRNIRVLVTAADVLHAFAMPAFGIKSDAVPGRINELWFNAEREGTYYGQCSELCGVEHAYMPIEIRVVSQGEFERWVQGQRVAAGLPAVPPPATPAVAAATSAAGASPTAGPAPAPGAVAPPAAAAAPAAPVPVPAPSAPAVAPVA